MTLASSLFCHLATSGSLQQFPILLLPRTSQHLPHLCCRRQHPTIGLDTSQTTMSPSLSLHTPGGGRGNGTQHSSTSLLLAPSVFFRSNYSRPLGVGNRQQQYTLTTRPPPSPGPPCTRLCLMSGVQQTFLQALFLSTNILYPGVLYPCQHLEWLQKFPPRAAVKVFHSLPPATLAVQLLQMYFSLYLYRYI